MGANYVGPGWYWVENNEAPVFLGLAEKGEVCVHDAQALRWFNHIRGQKIKIITHIPRPAQRPIVDWSVMPAWAKWVAMDEGGEWCWFVEKPDPDNSVWLSKDGRTGTIPMSYWPKYTGDWRNSLVERPE